MNHTNNQLAAERGHITSSITYEEKDNLIGHLATAIHSKFHARESAYAKIMLTTDRNGKPQKNYYTERDYGNDVPISVSAIQKHIQTSDQRIGIYVTDEGKDASYSVILDADDHAGILDFSVMQQFISNVSSMLTDAKIHHSAFRSGGGTGVHIWITFSEPVENRKLREFMRMVLSKCSVEIDGNTIQMQEGTAKGIAKGNIEIFPKQKEVKTGNYGNLIALPLGGKSEPLDNYGNPCCRDNSGELDYQKCLEFVENHQANPASLFANFEPPVAKTKNTVEKSPTKKEKKNTSNQSGVILEGTRNDTLFKYSLELVNKGMTDGEICELVLKRNSECSPPLDDEELVSVIKSAQNYKKGTDGMTEEEALERFNDRFINVMYNGKSVVFEWLVDESSNGVSYKIMPTTDFTKFYNNQFVRVKERDKEVLKGAASWWLSHPLRRSAEKGVVFDPKQSCSDDYVNLFHGYSIKGVMGDASYFAQFVYEVICHGDDDVYLFVWKWIAHLIQKPWELPETALILMGEQGTGKNFFVDIIGKLVHGYYMMLNQQEQVTGRFNGHHAGKLLMFFNEASWGGDKSSIGKIKSMITDRTVPIERKGLDMIDMDNYSRIIFASNEDYPVHLDVDDRRLVILKISNQHKRDKEYFSELVKKLKDGGYEALMYHFMNGVDISDFNPREKPRTEFEADLLAESASPLLSWLSEVLEYGIIKQDILHPESNITLSLNDITLVPKQAFYDDYVRHCKKFSSRPKSLSPFFKAVKKEIGFKSDTRKREGNSRNSYVEIPPLDEAIEQFESKTGLKLN